MFKDYQQIVDEMLADYNTHRGRAADATVGAILRTVFQVIAVPIYALWYALAKLLDLFFVGTSTGQMLRLRVREKGIIPHEGTLSSGKLILSRSSPAPIGTALDAGATFTTLESDPAKRITVHLINNVQMPVGWTQIVIDVEADEVGEAGNLVEGTPLQLVGVSVTGIESVSVAAPGLVGGSDPESDEDIRERYYAVIQNPDAGGRIEDYENWARSVEGVSTAIGLRRKRGPWTVDIVIWTDDGPPSEEILERVRAKIEEHAPATDDWIVYSAIPKTVDVQVQITPKGNYNVPDVTGAVRESIIAYLRSIPVGGIVRFNRIGDAVINAKINDSLLVEDYVLLTPNTNIELDDIEAVVVGEVTIT